MKFYLLDSTFDFGQYKGKTLEYVANENAMYIEWCIINVDSFLISHYVALEIKKNYPRFLFNINSQRKLEEKTTEYWGYLDNKAQSEFRESASNWDNDYYNDSLDIDQQDPEWWDSL